MDSRCDVVHFRGCELNDDAVFSAYSGLFEMDNAGPAAELLREFRSALRRHADATFGVSTDSES